MAAVAHRVEICPTCHAEFVASPVMLGGTRSKECPKGHIHSVAVLVRFRRQQEHRMVGRTLAHHLRAEGLSDNHLESLELSIKALLGAYERLIEQLPAGAPGRAQVEALFAPSVNLARSVVA